MLKSLKGYILVKRYNGLGRFHDTYMNLEIKSLHLILAVLIFTAIREDLSDAK